MWWRPGIVGDLRSLRRLPWGTAGIRSPPSGGSLGLWLLRWSDELEKATYESVPFRVLAANQHPDHATIAELRRRHLEALARLFVQVLRLCEKAGLVRLGHVALDGTKLRANASKHKAMSYGRMEEKVRELEAQVAELLAAAEAADQAEDTEHGSRRGDELPEELRFRQQRLEKIRQAKAALEAEARAAAQSQLAEPEVKADDSEPPVPPEAARPAEKAQRNFTDPDSRIMRDGATKSFEQSYNCQAIVDSQDQVIVAAQVTQQANDKQQVQPLVEQMKVNLEGRTPGELSADVGYFSEDNLRYLEAQTIDSYIATGRQKHGAKAQCVGGDIHPDNASRKNVRQAPNNGRQEGVLPAQGDGRAGLRANQGGSGSAPISVPWLGGYPSRVEPDLCHPQPVEAVPERVESADGINKAEPTLGARFPTSQTPG